MPPKKSSRVQWSACDACRHRRVKCDARERYEKENILECSRCRVYDICCKFDYVSTQRPRKKRTGKRIEEARKKLGSFQDTLPEIINKVKPPPPGTFSTKQISNIVPTQLRMNEKIMDNIFENLEIQKHLIELYFNSVHFQIPILRKDKLHNRLMISIMMAWSIRYSTHPLILGGTTGTTGTTSGTTSYISPSQREQRLLFTREAWSNARNILFSSKNSGIENIQAMFLFSKIPIPKGYEQDIWNNSLMSIVYRQAILLGLNRKGNSNFQPRIISFSDNGDDNGLNSEEMERKVLWWMIWNENISEGIKYGLPIWDDVDDVDDDMEYSFVGKSGRNLNEINLMIFSAMMSLSKIRRDIYKKVILGCKKSGNLNEQDIFTYWSVLRDWSIQNSGILLQLQSGGKMRNLGARIQILNMQIIYNATYILIHVALNQVKGKSDRDQGDQGGYVLNMNGNENLLRTSRELTSQACLRIAEIIRQEMNLDQNQKNEIRMNLLKYECGMISEEIFQCGEMLIEICREIIQRNIILESGSSGILMMGESIGIENNAKGYGNMELNSLNAAIRWCIEGLNEIGKVCERVEEIGWKLKEEYEEINKIRNKNERKSKRIKKEMEESISGKGIPLIASSSTPISSLASTSTVYLAPPSSSLETLLYSSNQEDEKMNIRIPTGKSVSVSVSSFSSGVKYLTGENTQNSPSVEISHNYLVNRGGLLSPLVLSETWIG